MKFNADTRGATRPVRANTLVQDKTREKNLSGDIIQSNCRERRGGGKGAQRVRRVITKS